MKQFLITAIAILYFYSTAFCQETKPDKVKPSQTNFYAELGGPGILFSANIDKRFKRSTLGWGFRAGIGFVTTDNFDYDPITGYSYGEFKSIITVPLQVNYIFGKENSVHTFEVGAGFTVTGKKLDIFNYSYNNTNSSAFFGTTSFMYRRQPKDGGFMWRIGFTPLFTNGYIQPFGGISVGYSF